MTGGAVNTEQPSNIIRRLLDAGLIREAGRLKGAGLGKPRTLLELAPTGQYAVGVHLDPAVVSSAKFGPARFGSAERVMR
jgi:hypothetical protein